METHYLIDYENTGKNGLKGCENLSNTDHIHIFFTDNSKNTSFDIFADHGNATLDFKEVLSGEQSLDKHLIAYLGYLVGKNANKKSEYVIVSSDKGYDKVGEFLLKEYEKEHKNSISVSRRNTIEKIASIDKVDLEKKTELKQQIRQALNASEKMDYTSEDINEIVKVVTSLYGYEKFKSKVHNALHDMYPEDDVYLDVYKDIKPIISRYT